MLHAVLAGAGLAVGLYNSYQNSVDASRMRALQEELYEKEQEMDWYTAVEVSEQIRINKEHNITEFDRQIESQELAHATDLKNFDRDVSGYLDSAKAQARINNLSISSGSALAEMTYNVDMIKQDRATLTKNQQMTIDSFKTQKQMMIDDADQSIEIVMAGKEDPAIKKAREEEERKRKEEERKKKEKEQRDNATGGDGQRGGYSYGGDYSGGRSYC